MAKQLTLDLDKSPVAAPVKPLTEYVCTTCGARYPERPVRRVCVDCGGWAIDARAWDEIPDFEEVHGVE